MENDQFWKELSNVLPLEKLIDFTGDNRSIMYRFLSKFSEEFPKQLQELEELLAQEDFEGLRNLIHTITPTVRMCMPPLSLKLLEDFSKSIKENPKQRSTEFELLSINYQNYIEGLIKVLSKYQ